MSFSGLGNLNFSWHGHHFLLNIEKNHKHAVENC